MLTTFFFLILKVIPLLILFISCKFLFNYNKKNQINYFNYIYIFKFIIFSLFLILYYIFYIFIYIIYFTFKNFRFFKYYYSNMTTAFFYYKKKSIYFLFWRYLINFLYLIFKLSLSCVYAWLKINIKNLFFINNIYLIFIIFFKVKVFINNNVLIKIYNFYIYCIYHLFYFLNIDEVFNIIKSFNFNFLNILKFSKDPILNRNVNFTWFNDLKFFYYKIFKKNYIFNIEVIKYKFFRQYIFNIFMYQLYQIYIYFNMSNFKLIYQILSNIYIYNKINKWDLFDKLNNIFKLFIYFFNLILINMLYNMILYFTYFIYICLKLLIKLKYLIISCVILLICIKYYWVFYYYFFLLYKHYLLYIPLLQVKESTRFFNFEWVDLRNYFNLIFLHNTLVDLTIFNNVIYNDLLNNLNKTLSVYGFKVGTHYDINLYTMLNLYNKDTVFLDNLLSIFNKSNSVSLWKWYNRLKKLYTNKAQMLFRFNKQNYKNSKFYAKSIEKSIRYNSIKQEGMTYLGLNRENFFRNNYKQNLIVWKLYNKTYFKKIPLNYISVNISNIKKIKKIPLRYIYLYNHTNYMIYKKNFFNFLHKLKTNLYIYRQFKKYTMYFLRELYKLYEITNYTFFFGRIYNFDNYKNKMHMKYKIPTFEWTALRWRRKTPNHLYFNTAHLVNLDENQKWYSFYELAKKKIKKKRIHLISYLNYKYPFCLNNNKNIIESLSYLKQLDSYIKIIKKYYYIKNSQIYFMKRHYKRLLHSNNLILKTYIYRLKNWNEPFFKKQLSNKNSKIIENDLNFWYFFEYLKVDKYYYTKYQDIYKEDSDLTLYFIKKTRKDYIKLRNHLLRMYSLFFHYYYLERAIFKHYVPIGLRNTKLTKVMINFKNKRILWNYESFKINWMLKIYLTRNRANKISFHNINIISKLFKQHFFAYFIYCDHTINTYNDLYYIKITSYSLKILNKINNLKRFFYFQNKYISGWSIFKYINSFSLTYHIKHLMWNSPYSFLFLQNDFTSNLNYINNDINITHLAYEVKQQNLTFIETIINYILQTEPIIINFHNYSMLFNLYLNVIELNNNWYDSDSYLDNNIYFNLYLTSFSCYYNCGYSRAKPFYLMDAYRFITNFIFEYYINFLYRLTRYRYILNFKNYTFYDFIKRYFNFETKLNFYLKLRILANDLKFVNRFYKYLLSSKNKYSHNAYKKTFAPFWFIFEYYTKLFVYFLLNKYYVKEIFVYYWIYKFKKIIILNYNLVFFTIIYYNIKLCIYINLKNFFIIFNINLKWFKMPLVSTFYWYLALIFQFNINYIYLLDISKINIMLKWILLFWVQLDLYKYNFNKIIFAKLYIEKLIIYYLKIFFNFKNNFIFFKPNYIYFRKQRDYRALNRMLFHNIIFKNTITYRNKNTFKHLTNNILFFKNIYLTNIYNYVYLFNMANLNIGNFVNLFFYLFKYNYAYLNIIIFILLYWFMFLLLFMFYKKFYNIFFFCYFENTNYEYNWNKLFKNKVIILSKNFNKKKYDNLINNKWSFNNFFFNTFFKKLNFKDNIKHKILYLKNKQYNEKYWNNNNVLYVPLNLKLAISPYIYVHKYVSILFSSIVKIPIKIQKENKLYNFYFHDFLNNNLFSFCIFYWFLLIPYFFFEFILMKYHLRGHVLIKRRMFLILKVILDNFKWFVKLFKIIGDGVNIIFKHRHPKTYKGVHVIRNKKKLKLGYFFKWDRMHKQRLHISPLGSYYYWFFKINKIEYFLSIRKYYFNNISRSNYFYYIYIYYIFLFLFLKQKINKKGLNFIFIKLRCLI